MKYLLLIAFLSPLVVCQTVVMQVTATQGDNSTCTGTQNPGNRINLSIACTSPLRGVPSQTSRIYYSGSLQGRSPSTMLFVFGDIICMFAANPSAYPVTVGSFGIVPVVSLSYQCSTITRAGTGGQIKPVTQELDSVNNSRWTVANSATFLQDTGVTNLATGQAYVSVGQGGVLSAVGQYSYANGVYTVFPSDPILFAQTSYTYNVPAGAVSGNVIGPSGVVTWTAFTARRGLLRRLLHL